MNTEFFNRLASIIIFITMTICGPVLLASPDLHLEADCFDQIRDESWVVRVTGDGQTWNARVGLYKGFLSGLGEKHEKLASMQVNNIQVIRNFPQFREFTMQIPLVKSAQLPYESMTIGAPVSEEYNKSSNVLLRPSILSSESVNLGQQCTVSYGSDWEDYVREHDLELLNESAPPAVCKIVYGNLEETKEGAGCSGTLVTPDRLITAAHCDKMFLGMQAHVICPGSAPQTVLERLSHPKYLSSQLDQHDVAVFVLPKPFLNIKPLAIEEDPLLSQQILSQHPENCRLHGYGLRSNFRAGQIGTAPLRGIPESSGGHRYQLHQLSLGLLTSNAETFMRPGDSGGPVLCRATEGGPLKLQAVHSFMALYDATGNSALVNTPDNLAWIKEQLKK